jgi:hypothetical protein
MITETITPPPGHLLWKKLLMALSHLVYCRLTCTASSQTPLDPDNVADEMFSSHHGPRKVIPAPWDYDVLCPLFAWLPCNIVKTTFDIMTQYAHLPHNTVL